jgi:prepilin-type N-terminal cleavage/methylation domain-containing protein
MGTAVVAPSGRRANCDVRIGSTRALARTERGFTLIELLIVVTILPLIIGAIAMALVSVFSTQTSVSNRLSDSDDAQVVSSYFIKDVQSAVELTTGTTAACGTGTQLLGLESGLSQTSNKYQTVISYVEVANSSSGKSNLVRQLCTSGASTTPTSSTTVSYNISTSQAAPTIVQSSSNNPANGWISTEGVTNVAFKLAEPETATSSIYNYTLAAVPGASANSAQQSTLNAPTTTCGFAAPGTGTYAATLCFVSFAPWNSYTGTSSPSCTSGGLAMSAAIANTPFAMSFCMNVASAACTTGTAITGTIPGGGYNDIHAVAIPTWYAPPGGQAFLGNIDSGVTPPTPFYTGIPGDPALYTYQGCSTATITITQIKVTDSSGNPASGWSLVTGDAESTDIGESITWTSDQDLNLLPNGIFPSLPYGNACNTGGTPDLTGLGTTTVECAQTVVTNTKTGTVMLSASTPTKLTVVLQGSGLQAMFMGVLLPS